MSPPFVNPLARNGPVVINSARAIKSWVRELLALSDDAVVSVSELACHVPGWSSVRKARAGALSWRVRRS